MAAPSGAAFFLSTGRFSPKEMIRQGLCSSLAGAKILPKRGIYLSLTMTSLRPGLQ
jgi:hypothetical protein